MKAILVMEKMPEDCLECPLLNGSDECVMQDADANFNANSIYDLLDGCPLKPMPERNKKMSLKAALKQPYKSGIIDGWNACLDTIEGSKE